MNDKQLKRFAMQFRIAILCGNSSRDYCFMVSAPLAGLLAVVGTSAKLVTGDVHVKRRTPGLATLDQHPHYWIELGDGRILDATADQFRTPEGKRMPAVYVGKLPKWYRPI